MAQIQRSSTGRENLRVAIEGLGEKQGKVGWFDSSKYPNGDPVAGVMAVQEFGSPKQSIPPRSFFRSTADDQQTNWKTLAGNISKAVLTGKMAPDSLVEALALQAEGDVRKKISEISEPPLSVLTLLARKHRRDTGHKVAGGAELGAIDKAGRANGPPDVSGVSTKPLNDTGYALATLTSKVE